jgi:putative sterol carrier protein
VDLVLQQVVTGAPDGEVAYRVQLSGGRIRISPGRGQADITLTEDYDTALAVASGTLAPHTAFMTGRIRIGGDMASLVAAGEVLGELAGALAAVSPEVEP